MNQTLIKNVNIWTMDEKDTRFYGWVLLENGKIAESGVHDTLMHNDGLYRKLVTEQLELEKQGEAHFNAN